MRCWLSADCEPPDEEVATVPVGLLLTQLRAVVARWQADAAGRQERRVEHWQRDRQAGGAAGAAAVDAAAGGVLAKRRRANSVQSGEQEAQLQAAVDLPSPNESSDP